MRRNKQSLINVVNAAEYSQGEIDLVWVLGCDHTHRKQRSLFAPGGRRLAGIKTRGGRSRAKSEPIASAACRGYAADVCSRGRAFVKPDGAETLPYRSVWNTICITCKIGASFLICALLCCRFFPLWSAATRISLLSFP